MVYARRPSTRRRRSSSFRRVGAPRKSVWIRTPNDIGTAASGQLLSADICPPTSVDDGAKLGATVIRTHIRATFLVPVAAGALAYNGVIYVGASILPTTTPIGPGTAQNQVPWFFYDVVHPVDPSGLIDPTTTSTQMLFTREWDVKSNRVITQPGETVLLCVQPLSMDITAARFDVSLLIKLA